MIKNEQIAERFCNALCQKVTYEFHISAKDFPRTASIKSIIQTAYQKAITLFDIDSENSIIETTFDFYLKNIDKAIDLFIQDLDSFKAISKLLKAYVNVSMFMESDSDVFKQRLSEELDKNQEYYKLFPIEYFYELALTDGIDCSLEELERDVNIRAFTYYNAAYKEYINLLPGFQELVESVNNV